MSSSERKDGETGRDDRGFEETRGKKGGPEETVEGLQEVIKKQNDQFQELMKTVGASSRHHQNPERRLPYLHP